MSIFRMVTAHLGLNTLHKLVPRSLKGPVALNVIALSQRLLFK